MGLQTFTNKSQGQIQTLDSWRVAQASDLNLNDNSKTLVVPASTEWEVLSVRIESITTANAGNRQIVVEALDASDNILTEAIAGVVQAGGATLYYLFAQAVERMGALVDTSYITVTLSPIFLTAGWKLRVRDSKNIDPLDDLLIRAIISSRTV